MLQNTWGLATYSNHGNYKSHQHGPNRVGDLKAEMPGLSRDSPRDFVVLTCRPSIQRVTEAMQASEGKKEPTLIGEHDLTLQSCKACGRSLSSDHVRLVQGPRNGAKATNKANADIVALASACWHLPDEGVLGGLRGGASNTLDKHVPSNLMTAWASRVFLH